MQIDLTMIQCILQSNESLIRPLEETGWNRYCGVREEKQNRELLLKGK